MSFYDVKEYRKQNLSHHRVGRGGWTLREYDIPEGTLIEIRGTGLKEREIYSFHRVYLLDPCAPIMEETIDLGIHKCILKARLSLYQDYIAEYEEKKKRAKEEGF